MGVKFRQEDGSPSLSTVIGMETEGIYEIDRMWALWSVNRRAEISNQMIADGSQDLFIQENHEMIPWWKEGIRTKDQAWLCGEVVIEEGTYSLQEVVLGERIRVS
jgi:hypothetical protein